MLRELADTLGTIGVASHPENLDQIWEASDEHAKVMVCLLEDIPRAVVRPIIECLQRLCDARSGLATPQAPQLCRVITHLGTDPRSYREAVHTLRAIERVLAPDTKLDDFVGRCLGVLDKEGVLGRRRLSQLARFLRALDKRPGTLVLHKRMLSVGDDDLLLSDLHDLHGHLGHHSSLWGPRAASEVLYPQTHSYGTLTKVKMPVRGTLVVDEPSLALIPARTAQPEWQRVDPIPKGLTVADPQTEMQPYLHLTGSVDDPDLRSTLDVLYLGLRVVDSIVQKQWMNRLRLLVRLHDAPGNRACYRPDTAELHLWRGPMSGWAVVHELAHAIDDNLFDGPGLASDQHGHPLASFAAIVRPEYRSVAEERTRWVWDGTISHNFHGSLQAAATSGQTVPLAEVLDSIPWPEPFWRVISEQLVIREEPVDEQSVNEAFGQPMGEGAHRLLNVLQWGLVRDEQSRALIDWKKAKEVFFEQELNYSLSNREIFARFFDQYARLYWNQIGRPYGPTARPGDLNPHVLAAHVPTFHGALVEAQIIDMGHITGFAGAQYVEDTVGAVGVAAVLIGIGADLIRP